MTPANNADLCEWVVFFFHFLPWITEVSFPFLLSLVSTARREGHTEIASNKPPTTSAWESFIKPCAHVFPSLGERTSGAGVKSVELYFFLYSSLSLTKAG